MYILYREQFKFQDGRYTIGIGIIGTLEIIYILSSVSKFKYYAMYVHQIITAWP